ncbi:HEPN domain-containing protein [Streptomyces sp. NPDC048420]|uniref:HEPN domain-containing protein n=1 Tax=Streptomyces sp. NPDC048420 TaxID=3155755 RepID=UPI0034140115
MNYRSPFGSIDSDDHNGPDALCLSRTHCTDAAEDTINEFHQAAVAAIERRAPQPAFFLARQLAELSLKALHGPTFPITHSLTALLDSLERRGDLLVADGAEEHTIVAFIRDLDFYDANGDQGRYPTTRSGTPSLATVCCADPALLREHVDQLHSYVQRRLAARRTGAPEVSQLSTVT